MAASADSAILSHYPSYLQVSYNLNTKAQGSRLFALPRAYFYFAGVGEVAEDELELDELSDLLLSDDFCSEPFLLSEAPSLGFVSVWPGGMAAAFPAA